MKMKRFLALVLAICLVLGMVPAPVYAEETTGEQTSNETPVETTTAVEPTVPVAQSTDVALTLGQSESVNAAVGETVTYTFTPASAGDYILHFDFAPANGVDFSMQVPCAVAYFVDTTSYHVLTGLNAGETYTFTFTAQEDAISNGSIGVSNISPLTGATLNYSEISGKAGDTFTVRAIPNGGAYPEFHWSVEDTSVATVSGSGCDATVTLKSAGSTKLTATVIDRTDLAMSYDCVIDVTVTEAKYTLELNQPVAIPGGEAEYQFKFTAEEAGVYWLRVPAEADCFFGQALCDNLSNFDFKNASYHGRVVELAAGTECLIYMWGNGGEIGQIELVKTQYAERIDVDQASFVGWWNGNPPGATIDVTCTLYPAGSVTKEITYNVGNNRVVQIGKLFTPNAYRIQCNGLGTSYATLSTYEGVSVTIPVEVKEPWVAGISVDPVTMIKGIDTSDWTNTGDGTVYKVYNPETADPQITVTYVDGRIVICAWSELEDRTGLHMDHLNPLFDTSAWEAGSHTWKVMLLDDTNAVQATCDMTVDIVENPIQSFTLDPVTISEITNRYITTDENGTIFGYYDPILAGSPMANITFSDGNTLNCAWTDVSRITGYRITSVQDIHSTSNWVPGNEYTWQVQLEKNGVVYATYAVPVTLKKLEHYSLNMDAVNTVSLLANQKIVLDYTATENGFLWLWMPNSFSYFAGETYNSNLEVSDFEDFSSGEKRGEMIKVEAGQTYEITAYCNVDYEWSFTPTFMAEATDIQLETTEVEGYVGQTIWVPYTTIPAGSLVQLDFNNVQSNDNSVADYRGGAQEIGIGMNKAGKTTFTVTVGANTYTINITVKNPEPMNLGDVANVTLAPGAQYAIAFTAPTTEDTYYLCWDYQINGITLRNTTGVSDHGDSHAGDYNRIRMEVANDNQNCVLILKNTGKETQTFDLYLDKGVELQPGDLVITGPTEVEYGTEEVELIISVPMFADFEWFNWHINSGNAMINGNDNRYAMVRPYGAGTITVSATTDSGITAEHSVTVKPYGSNALAQWDCPGDGNTMSMDFTPAESGYYYLSCVDDGSASYSSMGVRENSEQPLNEFSHNGNGGRGCVYKLEANKTYTFVAHDVWSTHTFYMTKLDVATSVTVTPAITGKVHEQKQLQVTYTGVCKWSIKSSDESIVMTGSGNETSQEVFLLGEGTAQLIVTDQDGNTYICNVTVSGELGTEDMEIHLNENKGWDEMGLKAGDSQTYNFTPWVTGLYWVNSELDHKLGIAVENGGNPVAPEYVFNHRNDSQKYGAVYSLTQGVTYQITFTSDHNMTTFVNAQYRLEADWIECYQTQISGDRGQTGWVDFGLYNTQNGRQDAVGTVSVTSSDEKVIKITCVDGGRFEYKLTGGGEAQVTIAVNGVTYVIPVSVIGITSITVDDVTMIQGADTSDLTFDNDDHVYKVYDPEVKNPEVHISYSNGNSVTYHWNDIEAQTGMKMGHYNDLATTEGWAPGAHTWTVMLVDDQNGLLATYDMTVTILENPIKSVIAQPITLVEGMDVIIATGTPEGNVPYYDVDLYGSNTELTFTYSDDRVTTCTWWEAWDMTGYRVESVSGWEDSRYWIPGNSYTWTIAIKDDMGNTYATCDIPVHVQKLDRQSLMLDTAVNVSLNAYQHKILEFNATETGYLWLWTEGETFEVVHRILDKDFDRVSGDPHNAGNKYGVYFPVTAGQHYDIYVYSPCTVSNSITATMMAEATDIRLETTNVTGYVGQGDWINITSIPEGSLARLDYTNVVVRDESIVRCMTGTGQIGFEMLKAGSTTVDITVGTNTHTIHVTVKEPVALESGDIVKQLTLAPGETYGFRVTPDEDRDYIIAYDKNVRGIIVAFNGYSVDDMPQTAEYHRSKLCGMFQGNSYTCVLRNEGDETQTFDLYLGKVQEPQQGDLTITGPAEVAYGENIELRVDMPMFVNIPWINWSHDNYDIVMIDSQDSWYYILRSSGAGTVTVTAEYNGTVTDTHTVTIKPYGSDAIQFWPAPGDGSDMTMTFTPTEDGWYWLNYNTQGSFDFDDMAPQSNGAQPLNQLSCNTNGGDGMAYKLEAGKTYNFVAYRVYSDHTFYMTKLDMADSFEIAPAITGKVHEQKWLSVAYTGICFWEVESSDESVAMIDGHDSTGLQVFLVGEGTATLTVTDQDGNQKTCTVTVSGELDVQDFAQNSSMPIALVAGDSCTFNFTAQEDSLYWIYSDKGQNLDIRLEQNGVEISAEYDYGYSDGNDIRGKVYSLHSGETYQITFTSDTNLVACVEARTAYAANTVECWESQIYGEEDATYEFGYRLLYIHEQLGHCQGVGQVTVTSDNENVAKAISADGRHAMIQLVGEGSTTIYINVNGVPLYSIPVTVNPGLKATSFTVANVTMYERADTRRLTYGDGSVFTVYNVEKVNPYVTFLLSNGQTFEGYWQEVEPRMGLRMGHAEPLENTASWGVGDHRWEVCLCDYDNRVLGTCEIIVTIVELPSTVIPMDEEATVTLDEGETTGLRVTPNADGFLCLWINDRNANFEFVGVMDSAGLHCETAWMYDQETGRRGLYVAASDAVTYEFFVKASNSSGTAKVTPVVIPATTDITLETTEVVGYAGQTITVRYEKTPATSIVSSITCTANTDEAVAELNDWGIVENDVSFYLKSVGETVMTLKVNDKTYDIKITVLEPPAVTTDSPAAGTLASEEEVVYAFTPAENGNYIICVNNGINMDCQNDWQYECGTAEYNRKFLGGLNAGQTYYIVLTNYSAESQNYELSVGKAEEATAIGIVGKSEMIAENGEQQALEITMDPKFGYLEDSNITWTSDDENVVRVDWSDSRSAYVIAQNPGTATITATTASGLSATFTITVKDYKESVDQWWAGNEGGGSLNFSFTPDEDGYYHLHWKHLWENEPVLTEDGDQPLFFFEYGWSWSNGFVYQMEAGKTYTFHCDWMNSEGQIYMKKVEMATQYMLDAQSITGQVHGKDFFSVLANGIPYWEVTSSNEDVVMIGPGGSDWKNILFVGEGTATLTVTDHLGGVHHCEVTVSGTVDTTEFIESELIGLKANDSVTYTFRPGVPGMHWFGHEMGKDLRITIKQNGVEVPGYTFDTSREGYTGKVYQLTDDTGCEITVTAGDARVLTTLFFRWGYEANQMHVEADSSLNLVAGQKWDINYELRYVDEIEDIDIATFGKPEVTSSNDAVVQVTYDGGRAKLVAVDKGEATVTFKLNGQIVHEITVTVTKPLTLSLNEKQDVNYSTNGETVYALFTPEKTGYYAFYMDTPVSAYIGLEGYRGYSADAGVNSVTYKLMEGETYVIISWLREATENPTAKLWITESDYITGLEVVQRPEVTHYAGALNSGWNLKGVKLKATWSDGTTSIHNWDELGGNGTIGGHQLHMENVEHDDGTYTVSFMCDEAVGSYSGTLAPNPVASIEVIGSVSIAENTYGWDNGEFWYYSPGFVRDALKLKITYTDGTMKTIPASQAELDGYVINQDVEDVQYMNGPWTKDAVNMITYMYMGHEATAEVKIVDNWIEGIEVSGTPATEFRFGNCKYGMPTEEGYFFAPRQTQLLDGLTIKVTGTDGQIKEITLADLQWPYGENWNCGWYDGLPVEVYFEAASYNEHSTAKPIDGPCDVVMTVRYGWKTATFTVSVLPKEDVHVHDIQEMEEKAATYEEAGYIHCWYCEVCNTLFADEAGTVEIPYEEAILPKLVKTEVQKEELNQQIDEVLNDTSGSEPVKEVVVQVQDGSSESSVVSVALPTDSIQKIVDANSQPDANQQVALTVELNTATVTLDSKALETITEAAGNSREITLVVEQIPKTQLTESQQNAVADQKVEMVISAELLGTDGVITDDTDFGGGTATVKLPFTPAEGTSGSNYKILYVADDGRIEEIDTTYVDGYLVFTLSHFSEYVVVETKAAPVKPVNPFTDVKEGDFFYAPVLWAVENGITNGATATTFNPGGTCLRAQVVTFLHRAAGNPNPTSTNNPFSDVKSTDFFYKPVLWAVEKGITNGTSETTFGSYDNCNRAAVVTFLWRAAGCPEPKSTNNPFEDVKSTDFFYKAVLWAVENGITNGVDATHFGPTQACNRAQVVTFLYRAYN